VASITQYRGKTWRAVIRKTGYRPISKTFPTKQQAQLWATATEAAMATGVHRDVVAEARSTSVRELFEKFRDDVTPTRKGQRWERVRINLILRIADFPHRRLDQLSPEDIRQYRDDRLKVVSAASVNRELNLISGVFTYAIKEWGEPLRENPVHLVRRPAGNGKWRNKRWSQADLDALLKACEWDITRKPRVGRDYVGWAVQLGIETAMRLSELCALRVSDVHAAERYVTLWQTKNGDARQVPLTKRAQELLLQLVEGRSGDEFVFPLSSDSLGLYFREFRHKAGLVDLRFHDTRHEAATRLSKKLSNVLELSAVTGHRDLKSLKRYYNPNATELAQKLD
jgi:integrase